MATLFRKFLGVLFIVGLALSLYGCASKGITVESYIEDKPRVDQVLDQGNQGYLMGKSSQAPAERKTTRKIFVVEFSKAPNLNETVTKTKEDSFASASSSTTSAPNYQPAVKTTAYSTSNITAIEAIAPVASTTTAGNAPKKSEDLSGGFVEYTVDKDDTLQKISKKFYDNYNKWPKIYEANKDVIKNPDRLKPGVVIKIPNL